MMNRNKLALVIALIFSVGVVAGGIAYAQEALAPPVLDENQIQGPPPAHLHFLSMAARFLAFMPKKLPKRTWAAMACVKPAALRDPGRKGSAAEKAGLKKERCNPSALTASR